MDQQLITSEKFFTKNKEYFITVHHEGLGRVFSVEELYQHFKARMLAEIAEVQAANFIRSEFGLK